MTTHSLMRVVRLRSTKRTSGTSGRPGKRQHMVDAGAAGKDHLEIRRPREEVRMRISRRRA